MIKRSTGFCVVLALAVLCLAGPSRAAEASKDAKGDADLALVLLSSPVLPKPDAVIASFGRRASAGEVISQDRSRSNEPKTPTLWFKLGKTDGLGVALMPVPVPDGEADRAAEFSISGLDGWRPARHRAHLVVFLSDSAAGPKVEKLKRFTRALAAVTEATSGVVGVYWGAAGATHEPKFFLSTATADEPLALPLWTGISIAAEGPSRMSVLSLGMRQLGLPDLLLTAPKQKSEEAVSLVFDLLAYVAERGSPLPEGDTVGRTEEEKLKVTYVKSPLDPQKKVWRIDWP